LYFYYHSIQYLEIKHLKGIAGRGEKAVPGCPALHFLRGYCGDGPLIYIPEIKKRIEKIKPL